MSTAVETAEKVAPKAPAHAAAGQLGRAEPAGRGIVAARLGPAGPPRAAWKVWVSRAVWAVGRTGRAGLLGLGLLLASALFLVSTHLEVVADVAALRGELADARARAARGGTGAEAARPATPARALPARADVPRMLRELFGEAVRAHLAIDSGRYELRAATASGGLVRTRVAFPVTGPYPAIRAFLDATLARMPAVGLSRLVLARKAIGDGEVEAQIELTVYTDGADGAAGGRASPGEREARLAAARVVAPTAAAALFAPHSWYVPRPPPRAPPPPPSPPPPAPTAPALPYRFIGSYAARGEAPVYFLSRGDRVIDAHVGDQLDGVYRLESAAGGTLVFVYLPLDVRQSLPAGVPK